MVIFFTSSAHHGRLSTTTPGPSRSMAAAKSTIRGRSLAEMIYFAPTRISTVRPAVVIQRRGVGGEVLSTVCGKMNRYDRAWSGEKEKGAWRARRYGPLMWHVMRPLVARSIARAGHRGMMVWEDKWNDNVDERRGGGAMWWMEHLGNGHFGTEIPQKEEATRGGTTRLGRAAHGMGTPRREHRSAGSTFEAAANLDARKSFVSKHLPLAKHHSEISSTGNKAQLHHPERQSANKLLQVTTQETEQPSQSISSICRRQPL